MTFNLKSTKIYKAVLFDKAFPPKLLNFYQVLILGLGIFCLILYYLGRFTGLGLILSSGTFLGLFLILFPTGLSIVFFKIFNYYSLRYPKITKSDNIAEFLSFSSAKILDKSFSVAKNCGEAEVSLKSLATALLEDNSTRQALIRVPELLMVRKNFCQVSGINLRSSGSLELSESVKKTIVDANELRIKHDGEKISSLDLLASVFDNDQDFRSLVLNHNLDKGDLSELANWYEHIWDFRQKQRKFWSFDNLSKTLPIGADWVYGFAPFLTSFAVNLNDKIRYKPSQNHLTGRPKEINEIQQILTKSGKNNVLLVGLEGVGRERLINDFVELIVKGEMQGLNYKKVFDLNTALILGTAKTVNDVNNALISLFNEASLAGNIILVLNDIHNLFGGSESRTDISEILIPYLRSGRLQVIATTDLAVFHKVIESRSDLSAVFEKINVYEPDIGQTLKMLEEHLPEIESRSGLVTTYEALKAIVVSADRFITSSPFPEKAVDLLGEVVSSVLSSRKKRVITKTDVDEVVSRKTGVPQGKVEMSEKDKLVNLEKLMHEEIVGQNRAVEVLSASMRRLRAGLGKRGRPAGVFLFVGPTGVGKTLTAKILAKIYFGAESKMIRFDMSEYQDLEAIDRFLGNLRSNEPGYFVIQVRDNPFSLILLDEIEKANKNILNIFLQVFDEGHLTDVFGRRVSFEQNIIIATSNAGAAEIREMVKSGQDPSNEKEKIVDILIKGHYFTPELLNRFDEVVVFHPLSKENLDQIAGLLIKLLEKRLLEQGYVFKPNKEIIEFVSKAGFDPQFGARPMERAIRDKLESVIANKIINNEVQKGVPFSLLISDLSR